MSAANKHACSLSSILKTSQKTSMLKAISEVVLPSVSIKEAFSETHSEPVRNLDRECEAYCEVCNFSDRKTSNIQHITNTLSSQSNVLSPRYLPFSVSGSPTQTLLETLRDGIVLAHLINSLKPNTIALNRLNYSINLDRLNQEHSKAIFEVGENLNACINGAKKLTDLGIVVVNIGANDILDKNVDIVLGLVWQLIRAQLLQNVNLVARPELIRLLRPGESLKTLLAMNPEAILMRWFNFHLTRAGESSIKNFSTDLADSNKYMTLIEQICPVSADLDQLLACRSSSNNEHRAKQVLKYTETIECRKFVTARDIVNGNARLNLAFTAGLFNKFIGIILPTDEEVRALYAKIDSLDREVYKLRDTLTVKEGQMMVVLLELQDARKQHDDHMTSSERVAMEEVEHMKIQHTNEIEKQRIKFEITMEKKNKEIQELQAAHAQQFADVQTHAQQKYDQDLRMATRKHESEKKVIFEELASLKESFTSFFESNKMSPPEPSSSSANPVSGIRDCVIKLIEEFYGKIDETQEMQKKLVHMDHVNSVIGGKIHEYAEDLCIDKRREKKSSVFSHIFHK